MSAEIIIQPWVVIICEKAKKQESDASLNIKD